jgi:hypothetical protein
MALTPSEIEMIKALSESQRRLELMIGSAFGGTLGRLGVMAYQENPFNSPFTNLSQHNLAAAELGKEIGLQTKVQINKKKRKVSKYQKEFGKQFKKLKKKHPRTSPKMLMKKAHRATKKVMK